MATPIQTDRVRQKIWKSAVLIKNWDIPESFFKEFENVCTNPHIFEGYGPRSRMGFKFASDEIKFLALLKYSEYIENVLPNN